MPGFTPGGMIALHAQAQAIGGARRSPARRARKRGKRKARSTSKSKRISSNRTRRKPRPGTKAWMAYIRGMRGKKRK